MLWSRQKWQKNILWKCCVMIWGPAKDCSLQINNDKWLTTLIAFFELFRIRMSIKSLWIEVKFEWKWKMTHILNCIFIITDNCVTLPRTMVLPHQATCLVLCLGPPGTITLPPRTPAPGRASLAEQAPTFVLGDFLHYFLSLFSSSHPPPGYTDFSKNDAGEMGYS